MFTSYVGVRWRTYLARYGGVASAFYNPPCVAVSVVPVYYGRTHLETRIICYSIGRPATSHIKSLQCRYRTRPYRRWDLQQPGPNAIRLTALQLAREIEAQAATAQQQIGIARTQIAGKQREQRLVKLTVSELSSLPKDTTVYEGVGKMCV